MTRAEVTSPSLLGTLLEGPRALSEASLLLPAHNYLKNLPGGDGHAVMVLPGLLASDLSTGVIRNYLGHWGYDAKPWSLGRNFGLTREPDLEALMGEQLERHAKNSSAPVSLIGWSLGGVFARELARQYPEIVRCVITLGSPISGDPRATNAWRMYEHVSGMKISGQFLADRIQRAQQPVPDVPCTAIYSKSDSIVSWRISREKESAIAENVEVLASHLGMGFNPAVLYVLADRLRACTENWQPFRATGFNKLFFN